MSQKTLDIAAPILVSRNAVLLRAFRFVVSAVHSTFRHPQNCLERQRSKA